MQYSAVAVLALAATATASYSNETVVYTTEVHTAYTTVCPAATELTYNGVTYTATESETLTITNCPCTIVKPVTTSSAVYCSTCAPTYTPVYPTANATTVAAVPTYPAGTAAPTVAPTATPTPSPITASGANKVFALSGASLAGLLGLAAYLL
ncbi:hypothetical protein ACEPPN_008979 [Leptodophora sp. 'Broadleaf-Isolate-01']